MRYLVNGSQMRAADQYTIKELGIPSLDLMEEAAKACVRAIRSYVNVKRICVVCGSGNNGGDGFAISRLLLEEGYEVTTCMVGNPEHTTKETHIQIQRLKNMGHEILYTYQKGNYDLLVDAIFGVGLSREITGAYAEVICQINQENCSKLAVDIPSGISANTGQVMGIAFHADLTVTFQFEKLGQHLYPGKEYCGKLICEGVGISDEILKDDNKICYTLDTSEFPDLLPARREDSNKGSYGRLLIIAGSKGMSGACYLNAYAAYSAGAGLVRVYTEESNRIIIQQLLPEAIVTTYESDCYNEAQLLECLNWSDTLCIGSGLGTSELSHKILSGVLKYYRKPAVFDADALNMISETPDQVSSLRKIPCVLTPHMKEMSRLLHIETADLKTERISLSQQFANENHLVLVLKDSRTMIFQEGRAPYLNLTGNQSMAKGGSGDVLCGIIGGLLAQSKQVSDAAVLGTYLHGKAGDMAKNNLGSYSVLARDLITYFKKAIYEEERKGNENL